MIRSELIQKIAEENPHLFQRDVERIVNTIFDEIIEAMARGDRVELRGFGAFSVKTARCPHRAQPAHRRGGRCRGKACALLQDRKALAGPPERRIGGPACCVSSAWSFLRSSGSSLSRWRSANRGLVTLRVLPAEVEAFLGFGWAIELPLFVVIFAGIIAGLGIGFVWEWFREAKHRTAASRHRARGGRLSGEVQRLQGQQAAVRGRGAGASRQGRASRDRAAMRGRVASRS